MIGEVGYMVPVWLQGVWERRSIKRREDGDGGIRELQEQPRDVGVRVCYLQTASAFVDIRRGRSPMVCQQRNRLNPLVRHHVLSSHYVIPLP